MPQVVCLLALIVTSSAGKIFRSDFHSFDAEQNFPAEEAEADWGEEDWPSQPVQPHKQWHEPIVLKKRVPVYVPGNSLNFSLLLNIIEPWALFTNAICS